MMGMCGYVNHGLVADTCIWSVEMLIPMNLGVLLNSYDIIIERKALRNST